MSARCARRQPSGSGTGRRSAWSSRSGGVGGGGTYAHWNATVCPRQELRIAERAGASQISAKDLLVA